MKKIKFTFRKKLVLLFLLLGAFPSLLVGMAGYTIGSRILLENAQAGIATNLQQSVKIADMMFQDISERAASISVDDELNEIILREEPGAKSQLLTDNRKVSFILKKYLTSSSLVYAAHIITDYYTYTLNTNLPTDNQFDRQVLASDRFLGTHGNMFWMDTGWHEDRGSGGYYFSAAKKLNIVNIPTMEGGCVKVKPMAVPPVLVLYFKADLFDSFFEGALSYPDSQYYVLTPDDYVIFSSDREAVAAFMPEERLLDNREEVMISRAGMCVTNWNIVEVVPVRSVVKNMSLLQKISIIFAAAMTLLAVIVAFASSYRITRPINRLIKGIETTGEGNFAQMIPAEGNNEFAFLTMKFNEMNESISRLIDENYKRKIHEKENEIIALNMQLNPHFLYNTLATVNWMAIERQEKEIGQMIVKLCDILHYASSGLEQIVPFLDDMHWLESYLFIMQRRFVEKFKTEITIAPECRKVKVPKLFLQPFVENAILHGFENMESGGILKIRAFIKEDKAYFEVSDNGQGMSPEKCAGLQAGTEGNIGTRNTIRRIHLIYEGNCSVQISSNYDGVDICINFSII